MLKTSDMRTANKLKNEQATTDWKRNKRRMVKPREEWRRMRQKLVMKMRNMRNNLQTGSTRDPKATLLRWLRSWTRQ